MRAVFLTGIRQLEVRDAPRPEIGKGDDVLLKVDTIGVCGSDMHYYKSGRIGSQIVEYPWRVGHEFAGVVVAAGPEAGELAEGARVAVDPLINCGACDQCLSGRINTCRDQRFLGCPGQAPGSLCDYIVMPAGCCYPIPDAMTMEQAVLIEPFAIALWAQRLAGAPGWRKIGILGSGPIGLCVLIALKAAGPCQVYQTDLLDNRLELARRFGADWTANAAREDVVARITEAEPGGLDLLYECAGEQETLDQAVELLAPGGTLLLVGIPEGDRVSFDMNHMRRKEVRLQNVRRQNDCEADAIDMVGAGLVALDPLVTHRFALEQVREAYDMVADYRDGVVKAMIHVSRRP